MKTSPSSTSTSTSSERNTSFGLKIDCTISAGIQNVRRYSGEVTLACSVGFYLYSYVEHICIEFKVTQEMSIKNKAAQLSCPTTCWTL